MWTEKIFSPSNLFLGNGRRLQKMKKSPKDKEQKQEKVISERPSDDAIGRALDAAPTQENARTEYSLSSEAQMVGVASPFQPVGGWMNKTPCCFSPRNEISPKSEIWKEDKVEKSPSPERRRIDIKDDESPANTQLRTPPLRETVDVRTVLRDQHLSDNLRASLLMTAQGSDSSQDDTSHSYNQDEDPNSPVAKKQSVSIIEQSRHPAAHFNEVPSMDPPFVVNMAGETVYQRMVIQGEELSEVPYEDLKKAAEQLIDALKIRSEYMERLGKHTFPVTTKHFLTGKYPTEMPKKFLKTEEMFNSQLDFHPPPVGEDHWELKKELPIYPQRYTLVRKGGVVHIIDPTTGVLVEDLKKFYISKEQFLRDAEKISLMMVDGPLKSYCYRRLSLLQNKFQLHVLMNELRELNEQKVVSHKDFYNIRKVDTHIHAASSMNQKHLVRFIKKKLKKDGDTVVMKRNGKPLTLKDVFTTMGIRAEDLSVDMLDVHADRNTFHRFDKFNTKYNPIGDSSLRETFLKTDNYVEGKYFAELLKEVFTDLEDSKYQHVEMRLSIYGRKLDEWDKLAKWAIRHDVWSSNNKFMIQLPRLYDIYRAKELVKSFDDMLHFIFTPLFEATNNPASHPDLARFLCHVSGFDSVDDESKHEFVHFDRSTPSPPDYKDHENPPYSYYLFYMYANICALNAFRRMRGLNTFALRPHCGEAGHVNHLLIGYLTSESISHGILLRKVPVLQYLFYLTQMGIAMSPLSNNSLFISYQRNPLPEYLQKGLNVSLSTDDPLQFHYTREALMEEYSIAAQVWKLSSCDMCELARNSVLQSGFEDKLKRYWLGGFFKEEGVLGNDIRCTNVPDIRVSFRHETLIHELKNLFRTTSHGAE